MKESWSLSLVFSRDCNDDKHRHGRAPVPLYPSNVIKTEKLNAGSVVVTTKDSVDIVSAWYRKNSRESNGEKTADNGAHMFYTRNGATVDVEPGNRFDPGTKIGLVWDAKKYGGY
jgi:hypothetical protein